MLLDSMLSVLIDKACLWSNKTLPVHLRLLICSKLCERCMANWKSCQETNEIQKNIQEIVVYALLRSLMWKLYNIWISSYVDNLYFLQTWWMIIVFNGWVPFSPNLNSLRLHSYLCERASLKRGNDVPILIEDFM